ncbi:hypothetical protein Cni_G19673 [Canna indica]|uniref:Reverse transcriptase n=1 Tax=Canna indica TaxID=4628 RepID=A0AAQ3KLQ7_9LILI|nr:hypothetical protein Cni_G19673 [Canna indica]
MSDIVSALCVSDECELRLLYNKAVALCRQISLKWWAKSKQKWISDGDQNLAYFHPIVSSQRRINKIGSLVHSDGLAISDDLLRSGNSSGNFVDIFVALHVSVIDDACVSDLVKPFSALYVWAVIKALPNGKNPGIDNFTAEFYKYYWDINL